MAGQNVDGAPEILDLVHDSVIVRDMDGRIVQWNAAAEAQYGWARAEAVGRQLGELLPSSLPHSRESPEAQLLTSGMWEGEICRESRGGEEIWIDARWSLRRDQAGKPRHVIETGRDITGKRKADEAFRLNEYRFRNLFQVMAVGFWEIDFNAVGDMTRRLFQDGVTDIRAHLLEHRDLVRRAMEQARVMDVNDKTIALFGASSREQIVGGNVTRFWPVESEPVFVEAVVASVEQRPHYITETKLLGLDGEEIDVLFTVSWSPESRQQGVILLGVIDIGERKRAHARLEQSEARYRYLFDYMPISLWQLSARGILPALADLRERGVSDLASYFEIHPEFLDDAMRLITVEDVNEETVRLFGGHAKNDFIGPITPYWQASPGTLRRTLIARFGGEASYAEETKLLTLDGRTIDVIYTSAFPSALASLGITIVGVVPIGDRVKAEEALRRLQADFAHAARISMLGEFTASIAHEVNQPLAAIATNGEAGLRWLARPEPNLEEVAALAARIVRDARRAAEIIARIRSMAERRAPERMPLDLNDIIEEAFLFMRHDLQMHGVTHELSLAPGLPCVRGDRTQIQQVIVNLAMNGAQAMAELPNSGRLLSVRTEMAEDGGVRTVVEDAGPGMTTGQRRRLFESFFSTKTAGMGMGLAICRSIMEAHGGTIAGENRRGRSGARFLFTLPAIGSEQP